MADASRRPSRDRTAAALVLGTAGLWVLGRLARPFAWRKLLLVGSMAGLLAVALLLPAARQLLAFQAVSVGILALSGTVAAAAIFLLEAVWLIPAGRNRTEGPWTTLRWRWPLEPSWPRDQ